MQLRHLLIYPLTLMALTFGQLALASDIADAVMRGQVNMVRTLLSEGADVNEPQVDGATALHWAVLADDLGTAQVLLNAGANPSTANRVGATPMQLAAINGNADMLEALIDAGAAPDETLTQTGDGDTILMMAARTGVVEAVQVLLDHGADVNAMETWSNTTPLMWAVAEGHAEVARLLIEYGAELDVKTKFQPPDTARGFVGSEPRDRLPEEVGPQQLALGELTPLMMAAREGDLETVRVLVEAGADINAYAADGKGALALAIFNGGYEVASYLVDSLVDSGSDINHVDARGFTPLFWVVDRRNMETATQFPWIVPEAGEMFLAKKLLDAGADTNVLINDTPKARMREGSPRIVFATALMRAAFSGDEEMARLLLDYGADPFVLSSDNESVLSAAAGLGIIQGMQRERSVEDRLEMVKLLVELGLDVNWHDDYGITPLMAAGNLGDVEIIQYLIDAGAQLDTYDLGKKNDGAFGSSDEPLMPVDYAIGVGTFRPNNSIVNMPEAEALMFAEMEKRGIEHTTSECTLRGFTCSSLDFEPRVATPLEIERARELQIGPTVTNLGKLETLVVAASEEDQPEEQ
jgi:ankyrin repeat protein